MAFVCKICVLKYGVRGGDVENLPRNEEEFFDHMESYHHTVVVRAGETPEQANARFIKAHPAAKTCPGCIAAGAEWAR
jgi:hypothetical protein